MFMRMYEWIYVYITRQYNLIFKRLEMFHTEKWGFKIAFSTAGNLEEILICNLVRWSSEDYSKQKQDTFLSHTCYPSALYFPFLFLIYMLSISQISLESMCFFTMLCSTTLCFSCSFTPLSYLHVPFPFFWFPFLPSDS